MKLIDDVRFDNSFSFIFSPRPGTPAANLPDDTPYEVKLRRLQELQAVINHNIKTISDERLGTVQRLLVEGKSKRDNGELMGRTECNRVVNFPGQERLIGQMVDVRIAGLPAPRWPATRNTVKKAHFPALVARKGHTRAGAR